LDGDLTEGARATPDGSSWLMPVPESIGLWLEIAGDGTRPTATPRAALVAPLLERLLSSEREAERLWQELNVRYAEIDLLYAISEILGHTVRLEEAARTIIRQVSRVVKVRRASILVWDENLDQLNVVAAQGFDAHSASPISIDDHTSIAARAFREQRSLVGRVKPTNPDSRRTPVYQGEAYLSVPISYAAPGTTANCIGVINLTDRIEEDQFTPRDRKLVTAVAGQIGAAIENARLAAREREQQRLEAELDLAHDLQAKLMPDPSELRGQAEVAVTCLPASSVGGDFYSFLALGEGRVGVMLGDVSSHGLSAALVMALVLSAAGIHIATSVPPAETLRRLRESLVAKLSSTEMYASVFYGVLDHHAGTLSYANAGHPYAFRIRPDGRTERLEATAPPLGLGGVSEIGQGEIAWSPGGDLLALWTDGLIEASGEGGQRFGEQHLLERLVALRAEDADSIVGTIMAEVDAFSPEREDDRTLLVLRI
jgi:sigma-B regulation protein RsbU (phosphoserine phosphatase)